MKIVKDRLKEEMGFKCDLNYEFKFQYEKDFCNNITEKEIDYVYIGNCENKPIVNPNPKEVDDWKWIEIPKLKDDLKANPEKYTYWFNISLNRVIDIYNKKYKK